MAAAPGKAWELRLRSGRFKLRCSSSPGSEGGHSQGLQAVEVKARRHGPDSQETMAMQSPDCVPIYVDKDMLGSGSPLSPSLAFWGSASARPFPLSSTPALTSAPMKETHTNTGKMEAQSPELLRSKGKKGTRKDSDDSPSPSSSCFRTPKRARAADFDASSPFYWWKFSPGYDWRSILPSYLKKKEKEPSPSPKWDTPDWSIMDSPPAAASSKRGTQQSVGREQMRVRACRKGSRLV